MRRRLVGKKPPARFLSLVVEPLEDRQLLSGTGTVILPPTALTTPWIPGAVAKTPDHWTPASAASSMQGIPATSSPAIEPRSPGTGTEQYPGGMPGPTPSYPSTDDDDYPPSSQNSGSDGSQRSPSSGTSANGNAHMSSDHVPDYDPYAAVYPPLVRLDPAPVAKSDIRTPESAASDLNEQPAAMPIAAQPSESESLGKPVHKPVEEHSAAASTQLQELVDRLFATVCASLPVTMPARLEVRPPAQETAAVGSPVADLSDLPGAATGLISGTFRVDTAGLDQALAKILDEIGAAAAEVWPASQAASAVYWFAGLGTLTLAMEWTRRLQKQQQELLSTVLSRGSVTSTWLPGRRSF